MVFIVAFTNDTSFGLINPNATVPARLSAHIALLDCALHMFGRA